jgi:cytochrome c biogenesis protein
MTSMIEGPPRDTTAPAWRHPLTQLRTAVRSLTSMRTALALLFLLTVASVPGALLPQRSLNVGKVDTYLGEHRTVGPLMDRLSLFDVFSAPWFTAIYGLLFVSLIGCLLPRTLEHARILRAGPVAAPRNLGRLPHHGILTSRLTPEEAAVAVRAQLRRWRTVQREGDRPGEIVLSAERGYSREVGNLVFHFSLIGLLVAVAVGKLVGYEGQIIVIADGGPGFCNTSPAGYDSFRSGLTGDGTGLTPFCVRVNDFTAGYLPTGQAKSFLANIDYQVGDDLRTNTWRPYPLRVNDPLRLAGDRVYLLGHGYAPRFTVTFPDGETRSEALQFRPVDATTLLSDGTLRFDPPAGTYPDPDERRRHEIAVTGLLASILGRASRGLSAGRWAPCGA